MKKSELINVIRKLVVEVKSETKRLTEDFTSDKFGIENELGDFYVVTKPTKNSLLIDILFKSDPIYFANQIRGGLKENEVYGFYKTKEKATKVAKELLNKK